MNSRFLVAAMLLASIPVWAEGPDDAKVSEGQSERGGRHGGPRRPPKEALDACQGKTSGAACAFQSPRGAETGACFAPRPELPLACRPARRAERPGHGKGGAGGSEGEPL